MIALSSTLVDVLAGFGVWALVVLAILLPIGWASDLRHRRARRDRARRRRERLS